MAPDHKGPNIDIPDELAEALAASEEVSEPTGGEAETPAQAPPAGPDVAEVAELTAQLTILQDRLLRMAADHENQKRRWLREQQDLLNYANENLVKDLLPTVDSLERALEHGRPATLEDKEKNRLYEGVEATFRLLTAALERAGAEVVPAEGVEFNPRFHEAMRQIPSSDHAPNTVVEVYQRGYQLKGRLLRPALVAIAAPKAPGD